MDKSEAKQILSSHLSVQTVKGYAELRTLVLQDHIETFEAPGPSGVIYQLEFQYVWDNKPEGIIRILGAIDDGGSSAYFPLSMDAI